MSPASAVLSLPIFPTHPSPLGPPGPLLSAARPENSSHIHALPLSSPTFAPAMRIRARSSAPGSPPFVPLFCNRHTTDPRHLISTLRPASRPAAGGCHRAAARTAAPPSSQRAAAHAFDQQDDLRNHLSGWLSMAQVSPVLGRLGSEPPRVARTLRRRPSRLARCSMPRRARTLSRCTRLAAGDGRPAG